MNKKDKRSLQDRNQELITKHQPNSIASESFKSIMTNIKFLSPDKKIKTIAVTSSSAKEGKSLISVNLGITMAQTGQKVLLIDTDLRKPMLHHFFIVPNFNGLSNILTGEIKLNEGIKETEIEKLSFISSGMIPPNPIKLLNSRKMENLLLNVEEMYDTVIMDIPPIIPVADSTIIGNKADGLIMVVASHETERRMLLKSLEKLENTNINILGTVLNKYPLDKRGYGYYYGEYYSGT